MSSPNSRLGFYYSPDDQHYTQLDLDAWLPVLGGLGARWLTSQASPERAIPESFIRGLLDSQIEPIIHIPCTVGSVSATSLTPLLSSYARWGVHYVVVHDRPNIRCNWEASDWGKTGLIERFIDYVLPILETQQSIGLQPVLPPLEPGGDYWDTAFLESVLESLIRRGKQDLLQELTLAIYVWTYGKPIDWGAGGFARWSEARPYHTPPGCQDQLGFHIYEWYSEIVEKTLHSSLPMLIIAGGELPSLEAGNLGPDPHTEQNLTIARALTSDEVPNIVLNFAFYHLTSTPDQSDHHSAWYPSVDQPLPVAAAINQLANLTIKKPPVSVGKPLQHYVLLPPQSSPDYNQNWSAIGQFVLAVQPVIGFSPQEASLAKRVTIFGDEQAIPKIVEEELRGAGCNVRRYGEVGREFFTNKSPTVATGSPASFFSTQGKSNE